MDQHVPGNSWNRLEEVSDFPIPVQPQYGLAVVGIHQRDASQLYNYLPIITRNSPTHTEVQYATSWGANLLLAKSNNDSGAQGGGVT